MNIPNTSATDEYREPIQIQAIVAGEPRESRRPGADPFVMHLVRQLILRPDCT